ncbi:hypothetical protein WR25_09738 [Diploscapter pachys]|uniref:Uncharacterized protein n=1 Tax=Diploscapter pachys TaxID=2018661 RepID=A0A2A2K2Z9_9BILA|nr:hypothetical protein WR25_09738 [Diploscapter pachys]
MSSNSSSYKSQDFRYHVMTVAASCMRKWVKVQKERTDGQVEELPSLGGRFFESFPNELRDGVDWTQYRDVFAIYYEASPAPALSAEEREQLAKFNKLYERKKAELEKEHEKVAESTKTRLDEALEDSRKEPQKAADEEHRETSKTSSTQPRHFRLKNKYFEVEYDN